MKIFIKCFLLCFTLSITANAQDIFDYSNSLSYLTYLTEQNKSTEALQELNRMEQTFGTNDELSQIRLKLLTLENSPNQLFTLLNKLATSGNHSWNLYKDCMSYCVTHDSLTLLSNFINQAAIDEEHKLQLVYLNKLLALDSVGAKNTLTQLQKPTTDFKDHLNNLHRIKTIKPKTVLLLSIIPGLGKIYANQKQSGLNSFMSVSLFSYLSFRGFSQKGESSVFGWIYGTGAMLFYLGNIQGSYSTALRYNNKATADFKNDVKNSFYEYLR